MLLSIFRHAIALSFRGILTDVFAFFSVAAPPFASIILDAAVRINPNRHTLRGDCVGTAVVMAAAMVVVIFRDGRYGHDNSGRED